MTQMTNMTRDHSHYFKDVSKLSLIDIYRVIELFDVRNPCIQHAIKKLLVAGGRGAGKDITKDIKEAIDSLQRWQEMQNEDKVDCHEVPSSPYDLRKHPDSHTVVNSCFPEVVVGPFADTNNFETSVDTYGRLLESLCVSYENQHVLIRDDKVIGVFPTREEAVKMGYDTFKLTGFITKQILRSDLEYYKAKPTNGSIRFDF